VVKLVEVCFLLSKEPKKHQFPEDLSLLLNELVVVAKIYDMPQANNTFELNVHTTLENPQCRICNIDEPKDESNVRYMIVYAVEHETNIAYMTICAGRMNLCGSMIMQSFTQ
jgi:hypothetical protein